MSSGLVLNTNINSLVAQNALTSSGTQLAQALEQLSTGLRINTAADDAAGYAIVNGMTSQINGLNQAAQNANDGVSLSQTASGALSEIVNDLQSMRDLAVESLNATNSSSDRADLDAQFQQLKADINSVASTTQFNGVNLLDGSFEGDSFQIGANVGQTITVSAVASAAADNLGELYTLDATDPAAYTDDGTSTGTAVASGDSGTFSITIGSKTYTTDSVSLTGTQATDLTSVAAAINQAVGTYGVVATVDSNSEGINLSSTTAQTLTLAYNKGTGDETLTTFGLNATSDLTPSSGTGGTGSTTYTATGGAADANYSTDVTNGDSGKFTVTLGGNQYTTDAVSLTGNQDTDMDKIAQALTNALSGENVTATYDSTTGEIQFSGSSSLSGLSVSYAPTGTAETETPTTFGVDTINVANEYSAAGGTVSAAPVTAGDDGTVSVTIGSDTYTGTLTTTSGATTVEDQLNDLVTALQGAKLGGTGATLSSLMTIALNSGNNGITFSDSASDLSGMTVSVQDTTSSTDVTSAFGLDGGSLTSSLTSSTATADSADANYGTDVTDGDSGTFAVTVGGNTYTTSDVSLTGNATNDLQTIATDLGSATDGGGGTLSAAGITAAVQGGVLTFTSNTVDLTGISVGYTADTNSTQTETTTTFGLNSLTAGSSGGGSSGTASASYLSGADVLTVDDSNEAVIQIDSALQQLATTGADLGAYQNRFQAAVTGLQTDSTNLSSARSQIQDTDYAQATSQLTSAQILQQAGTAMVAQANEIPQNVLTLLSKLT